MCESQGKGVGERARMTRPAAGRLTPEISQHVWVDNPVARRGEGRKRRQTQWGMEKKETVTGDRQTGAIRREKEKEGDGRAKSQGISKSRRS